MTKKFKAEKSDKIIYLNPARFKYKNTKETENLEKSVLKELKRQIKKIIDD